MIKSYLQYRLKEFLVWMGIPLIGALCTVNNIKITQFPLFILAIGCMSAHILTFNDWGEHKLKSKNLSEFKKRFHSIVISNAFFITSITLILLCFIIFTILNKSLFLLVLIGAFINCLYSSHKTNLKENFLASKLIHFIGGTIQFLLGYLSFGNDLYFGLFFGMFIAIILTSGHFFHEAKDIEEDDSMDIQTAAVKYGKKYIMKAGIFSFLVAHIYLTVLMLNQMISLGELLIWSFPLPLHAIYLKKILQNKNIEQAFILKYQSLYRLSYGLCALCFIILHN